MNQRIKRSLLYNNPGTTDVDATVDIGGVNHYTILGLPPIPQKDFVSVRAIVAVAEVAKVTTVSLAGTMVASTTTVPSYYSIRMASLDRVREGQHDIGRPYRYMAPYVLLVTAVDKYNMYCDLRDKLNRIPGMDMTAYVTLDITHQTDTGDNLNIGEILTGATSGATGIILSRTSVTVVRIALIQGTFVNGEAIDDVTGSGPYNITADPSLTAVGVRIVDSAHYYAPDTSRGGENVVNAYQGFATSDVVVTTAAVYAKGSGYDLYRMAPVREKMTSNLISGLESGPTNEVADVTKTYTTYIVRCRTSGAPVQPGIASGLTSNGEAEYTLYLRDDATNYAAYNTAITALT